MASGTGAPASPNSSPTDSPSHAGPAGRHAAVEDVVLAAVHVDPDEMPGPVAPDGQVVAAAGVPP